MRGREADGTGAAATALLEEVLRGRAPRAPRLDEVGELGVSSLARLAGVRRRPRWRDPAALGGDLADALCSRRSTARRPLDPDGFPGYPPPS